MAEYDITALGSNYEFDTSNANSMFIEKLSDTRFVVAWQLSTSVHRVQTFDVDPSDGSFTPNGSPVSFYGSGSWEQARPSIVAIDEGSFVIFWCQYIEGNDPGYARSFTVDAGGSVSYWGAQMEFDSNSGAFPSAVLMANDGSNARILASWDGDDYRQRSAQIFTLDLSTGTITKEGTETVISSVSNIINGYNSIIKLSEDSALVAYSGVSNDGYARVLSINTSTWVVSTASAEYRYYAGHINGNSLALLSESSGVAINAYQRDLSTDELWVQAYSYTSSSVSNLGSALGAFVAPATYLYNSQRIIHRLDDTHFVLFYDVTAGLQGATYSIDLSTGATTFIDSVNGSTNSDGRDCSTCDMGNGLFVAAMSGGSDDGFLRAFQVELPASDTPSNAVFFGSNF